ncbi:MAG: hypothetical protein DBX58_04095 [Clostridiales bacterium]|nr:MAG: hypothetical protein DBX58_04095 [Clostridiales bacterium]
MGMPLKAAAPPRLAAQKWRILSMEIQFGKATLSLAENGMIVDMKFGNQSIFPKGQPSYMMRFFREGKPEDIRLTERKGSLLRYHFRDIEDTVSVLIDEKEGYTVFQVMDCPGCFDFLTIGPIVTALNDVVGDVVGVVQGKSAAIGIQALNEKTLPGIPCELIEQALYRRDEPTSSMTVGNLDYTAAAAFEMPFGSVLHLFCENRRRDRMKTVLYAVNCVPAPAMDRDDADIRGTKFALFSCDSPAALETIGRIEVGEGLPHPMLDGEWLKTSAKATSSYLIGEFGIETIDKMTAYAQKGGFSCLYHPEPFETWGHFELRKELFPKGDASLKECVEYAKAQRIKVGLHTLSNFTKTNDAYVTPVPDRRLKAMAPAKLAEDIAAEQIEIAVDRLAAFECPATLNCVRIDDELLQYSEYEPTDDGAAILKGCIRGAFGTEPAAHTKGNSAYKLIDYPYQTLFPDVELQDEFSDRIAELVDETGVSQISFDGLEGCEWTGEGEYAVNRFAMRCYEKFDHTVINDASRLHHFLWHMNTRMNWGEPWGEEMRVGQVEGRMRNQKFFQKNLLPAMLGWFLIRKANRKFEASTLMDMEWALSEAAGFDAGFALSASEDTLDALGTADEILEAIKNWERLRLEKRFGEELKEQLKKPETEWHLEKKDDRNFALYPMAISKPFVCDLLEMQPGQPGGADWSFENPFGEQKLAFRMKIEGYGYIEKPRFYTRKGMIRFDVRVKGGQYLIFDGAEAYVTDRNYNRLSEAEYEGTCLVEKGIAPLSFGCSFGGEEGPEVTVRVITKSTPYAISRD